MANVTLHRGLALRTRLNCYGFLRLESGVTVRNLNASGTLYCHGASRIEGRGTIDNIQTLVNSGTLRIGSATTVRLGSVNLGANTSLVQQGRFVDASVSAPSSASFTNEGTLEVNSGRSSLVAQLRNAGRIVVQSGGDLGLSGATTTSALGRIDGTGSLRLLGAVDNRGFRFTTATALTIQASFTGGTIVTTGSGVVKVVRNGVLQSSRVEGKTVVEFGTITGGFSFRGTLSAGTATLAGTQTLGGDGVLDGGDWSVSNGTLTIGKDVTVTTQRRSVTFRGQGRSRVVNDGTMLCSAGFLSFYIPFTNRGRVDNTFVIGANDEYVQEGGSTRINRVGAITGAGLLRITGGVFGGTGSLTKDVELAGGVLDPGSAGSTGTLRFSKSFRITSGVVRLALASRTQFDRIQVDGAVPLGGTLVVERLQNYVPSASVAFPLCLYASRTGTFTKIQGLDLGNGRMLVPSYGSKSLVLTAR